MVDTPNLHQRAEAGLVATEGEAEVEETDITGAGHILHPLEGQGQDLNLLAVQEPV